MIVIAAGSEVHLLNIHILSAELCKMTAAKVAMRDDRNLVRTNTCSPYLEYPTAEHRVDFSRDSAFMPLARKVGYAVHVMVWVATGQPVNFLSLAEAF